MPRRGPEPRRITITRYQLPDGTRACRDTPGAQKLSVKSETYYANLPEGRVSLETTDLGEAWERLRQRLRERYERSHGLRDRYTDQAARPLVDHVGEWAQSLADAGNVAAYVRYSRSRVLAVATRAGWERITDLDGPSAERTVAAIVRAKSLGPATRNYYVRHLRQLSAWLVSGGRLRADPFATLRPVREAPDVRHARREPTAEELARLFAYLEAAPVRLGLSAAERALGYRLALGTGLRALEVASLTPASFALDADPPTVTVRAGRSKHRALDVLPLPPWLATDLRTWFAAGNPWRWHGLPRPGLALEADLQHAGIARSLPGPDGPLFLDFHSLRHWYVTQLASTPGITPKALMELARHRDANLTLRTYAKPKLHDLAGAAEAIPSPVPRRRKRRGNHG